MTLDEFDQQYPNGLDDAKITVLTIDYHNRVATLQLSMRGHSSDGLNSQGYGHAALTLRQFYYFSIEPPETNHLYPVWPQITVGGHHEDPGKFPLFEHLKPTLPVGAFCCRFYVHDWNSFIHVAAPTAELSWLNGDPASPGS